MSSARAAEALHHYFGFADFREGQAEVVDSVLDGNDVVVVMPTGGGKSLCFQLPAMMIEGVTVVVSPLIALMKDQVDALVERGLPTTFINSSLSYSETNKRLSELRRGLYKLVYVAPERFRSQAFMSSVAEVKVKLLAVDEAHCISHWGHDFRPDYLRLREAAANLGRPQIIALTATATDQVRADISEQLGLKDPRVWVAGFDRPNLYLRVSHTSTEKEKIERLKTLVRDAEGSGIIYAATRKAVEQVTAKLKMAGLRVEAYHAGMNENERTRTQDRFMRGNYQAIVATNAFGMGIDKRDIRFVVHYHLPGSIEAYYQEIGRAGRDGLPAACVLFFNYADTRTQQFFIEGSHPPPDLIREVYDEIALMGREVVELSAREIASLLNVKNEMSVATALTILERAGHIERGRVADTTFIISLKASVDKALDQVSDESIESAVLRELIFNAGANEREQVEVEMAGLSSTLKLAEPQVRRAIGALSAKGLLGYRNAYSGRGIRLLDEKPAAALRIDKQALAARAAAEQWKLRRMLDYSYHDRCLRRFLLNYFGDRKRLDRCQTCSACAPGSDPRPTRTPKGGKRAAAAGTLTVTQSVHSAAEAQASGQASGQASVLERFIIENAPAGEDLRAELRRRAAQKRLAHPAPLPDEPVGPTGREPSEAEVVVIKKILSCVARLKNKFGKGTVAAVLRGSRSKQVIDSHLDKLSTYGLLKEMNQDEITQYIRAMIAAGCVEVHGGLYPTVGLTDYGREVMMGQKDVLLDLPL